MGRGCRNDWQLRSQESLYVIADASLHHFPRRAVLHAATMPWGSAGSCPAPFQNSAGSPKDGASSNAGLLANSASGNALGAQAGHNLRKDWIVIDVMWRLKQARSFADSQLSICNPWKLGKLWKSFSCLMGISYAKLPLNVTRDSSAGSCQHSGWWWTRGGRERPGLVERRGRANSIRGDPLILQADVNLVWILVHILCFPGFCSCPKISTGDVTQ
jgi:hypothetical protein